MSSSPIAHHLDEVRQRIAKAAADASRDASLVELLAVSKTFPADDVRAAFNAGQRAFGENYVQEFEEKAPAVRGLPGARFHLIGHLQSNKTKKAAQLFSSVDSIDSVKLAQRLDGESQTMDAMIEVKLSEEETKSGAEKLRGGRAMRCIDWADSPKRIARWPTPSESLGAAR